MNLIGCQVTKWFLCEQLSPVYLLKVASSCKTGGTEGPGGAIASPKCLAMMESKPSALNDHGLIMPLLQIFGPSSGPELYYNTWHSILNFCIHIRLEESYNNGSVKVFSNYRTRAIITRGLYTFYPIFEGQKRFFKELFLQNSDLMYG